MLDVEAAFAELAAEDDAAPPEPEAREEEPEAVEEPEAEAGVAADSFSTPAVSTTGTPANSLPEKLVVVTKLVLVDAMSDTWISKPAVI